MVAVDILVSVDHLLDQGIGIPKALIGAALVVEHGTTPAALPEFWFAGRDLGSEEQIAQRQEEEGSEGKKGRYARGSHDGPP